MDILQTMGVDPTKANDGVWVRLTDDAVVDEVEILDDPAIKVAKTDNIKHRRALTKRLQPILNRRSRSDLDVELTDRIQGESIYGTVVLDWRNIAAGGEPFPCTAQNVELVWTDIRFSEFKATIESIVQRRDLFRSAEQEEREKN